MRSDWIKQAFAELYPQRAFTYDPTLKYSGKFRGFNANISLRNEKLTIGMSKQWRGVSKDIQMGCMQDLLVRLFSRKGVKRVQTTNMLLYNAFLRNVHLAVPKTKHDEVLGAAFDQINDQFFAGMMQKTNLVWFTGTRTLGLYEYDTDTIKISKVLANDEEIRNYVLYHEMLHKKHKFSSKAGRCLYHSKEFRKDEKKFPNAELLEKRLNHVGIRRKKKSVLSWLGL